jgi:hypothetical protein
MNDAIFDDRIGVTEIDSVLLFHTRQQFETNVAVGIGRCLGRAES